VGTSREVFDVVVGTHCPPNEQHPTTRPMTRETLLLSYYPIRTSYYCFAPPHPTEIPSARISPSRGDGDLPSACHDGDRRNRMLQSAYQEWLRCLALGDERTVEAAMCGSHADAPQLDDKTAALVRLACVVAAGSQGPALFVAIDGCHSAGTENDEIVEMIRAISPLIGCALARQATTSVLTVDGTRTPSRPSLPAD
jgi:alkylhydroperoxidase/carboxymuconolactone decarboxylase family protein YurZ